MTDGVGTTSYSYNPVTGSPALGTNLLKSVTSPIAGTAGSDVVVYSYDALNRMTGQTINGISQSVGFDAIGRTNVATNALDSFTYSYSDGTSRVAGISSNTGPTAALSYFGPTGDELLEQMNITTHSGATSLAKFGYTYNADNNVKSLTLSAPTTQSTAYGYDAANRLTSGLISGSTPQYAYGYDPASNLTTITPNGATQNYSYTSTNAITTGTYDPNGSLTMLSGKAYKWDGANRIVSFRNTAANTASSFIYDGLSRLVRVVDTTAGTVTADHSYTWCGSMRCLAHDNTQSGSPVSTEYFAQGAIIGGTPYYYIQDQLGSVTELVSATGAITSQFAYDPYGNKTTVSGTVKSDIGYAGYFSHAASGLDFTMYRAYDPTHARWLNRDPIAEAGGVNLYAYANGNPISLRDPTGLYASPWHWFFAFVALSLKGYDPLSADYIAATDVGFDFSPGSQSIANANWHSMATPGQSKACAQVGARNFINSQLGTGTLIGLGAALHTNEDSFARGHAYSEWSGHLTWAHFAADWLPSYSEMVNAVSTDLDVIDASQSGSTF